MSREVIIEERRYDKAGQEHTPPANVSTRGEPFDTTSLDGLDALEEVVPVPPSSLAASALAGSFGSSYGDDEANSDNPYAWAQRLRDIPDKVMSQKPAQSWMFYKGMLSIVFRTTTCSYCMSYQGRVCSASRQWHCCMLCICIYTQSQQEMK